MKNKLTDLCGNRLLQNGLICFFGEIRLCRLLNMARTPCRVSSSPSSLLSSLELSDKKVDEPQIRARLGTAAHFCEALVLKLRTVPIGSRFPLADYSQKLSCRVRGANPSTLERLWRRINSSEQTPPIQGYLAQKHLPPPLGPP